MAIIEEVPDPIGGEEEEAMVETKSCVNSVRSPDIQQASVGTDLSSISLHTSNMLLLHNSLINTHLFPLLIWFKLDLRLLVLLLSALQS